MHISWARFVESTGRIPEDDDMERVNCSTVGEVGHFQCGWCFKHDGPRFECSCVAPKPGASAVVHRATVFLPLSLIATNVVVLNRAQREAEYAELSGAQEIET